MTIVMILVKEEVWENKDMWTCVSLVPRRPGYEARHVHIAVRYNFGEGYLSCFGRHEYMQHTIMERRIFKLPPSKLTLWSLNFKYC